MAVRYAPEVRVNSVSPGYVKTPATAPFKSSDALMERYEELIPQRRGAEPEEIANAFLFLASEEASYVNGHDLVVDGGMTTHAGNPNYAQFDLDV